MDRDVALLIKSALDNIKTIVNTIATNSTPTASDSRSVLDQRLVMEEPEEEPEEPEPVTKEKK